MTFVPRETKNPTLAAAAALVRAGVRDHVRVGELVVMRASTFDVLKLSLKHYTDRRNRRNKAR